MKTEQHLLFALLLAGAAATTGCARKEAAESRSASKQESLTTGMTASVTALDPWEPVDNGFKGCEGG